MSETRRWAPSAVWAACILVITSVPASALPPMSPFAGADKLVHASMYALFGILAGRAMVRQGALRIAAPLVAIALFAAGDEWHQQLIPGRSADVLDWMADVAGATIGLTYTYMARPRRERRT